jgi:DNA (cytosine-5)-methyltransferase 1
MNELHLFAGAGGGILGGMLLGHTTVCAVEIEPYCREVLLQRQRDGILPKFPIWDDVTTFDGNPWRGKVDVVCGGFPCQDISIAGGGAGIEGERSGLWSEMARIIGEIRPKFAFMENSPMLTFRGLGRVLGDLSELGYDARWGVVGADNVGGDHIRKRIWILADSNSFGMSRHLVKTRITCKTLQRGSGSKISLQELAGIQFGITRSGSIKPLLARREDDVADRSKRLKAIGNGQVPPVAALAFKILGGECGNLK